MIPTLAQQAAALAEAWRADQTERAESRATSAENVRRSRADAARLGAPVRVIALRIVAESAAHGITNSQIRDALALEGIVRTLSGVGKIMRAQHRAGAVKYAPSTRQGYRGPGGPPCRWVATGAQP